MSYDISGTGIEANLVASATFPLGFPITEFADDADPIDIPSQQIADKAMTLNGDLVTWGTANHIPVTINVIPDSDDDRNLSILLEANRIGRGKTSARDVLTLVITNPSNRTLTLSNGRITDGPISSGVASSGRLKTKSYQLAFENKAES